MKNGIGMKMCIGYGSGALAEAGFYQFVTTFQLVFLTGVVKLAPNMAGTITSLTILVDAVCSIVVGRFSDQLTWRFGRRRPFILISIFCIPVTVLLSFTTIHQSPLVMFTYYTVMGALCWIAYSLFYIPYTALGAEIATDYNDRIKLRSVSRIFTIAATFMGTALPLAMVAFFTKRGISEAGGWFAYSILFGVVVATGLLICWRMTRGKEPVREPSPEDGQKESLWLVFRDFWQLIRIKSMAILIVTKLVFMVAFTFYTSGLVFFMQYKLGMGNETISSVYVITGIITIFYTPVITKIAMKWGKQQQVIMAIGISGVFGLILYGVGIDSYFMAVLYAAVFMYVQSSYWQLSSAIFYDITEVDEYIYGKRREGSITSLQSIAGTLAAAVGLQLMGVLLKAADFDASLAVQSERAMTELARIFVLYPSIALIFSGALLYTYPISRRRFEMLQAAIALRKSGQDDSMYREELGKL